MSEDPVRAEVGRAGARGRARARSGAAAKGRTPAGLRRCGSATAARRRGGAGASPAPDPVAPTLLAARAARTSAETSRARGPATGPRAREMNSGGGDPPIGRARRARPGRTTVLGANPSGSSPPLTSDGVRAGAGQKGGAGASRGRPDPDFPRSSSRISWIVRSPGFFRVNDPPGGEGCTFSDISSIGHARSSSARLDGCLRAGIPLRAAEPPDSTDARGFRPCAGCCPKIRRRLDSLDSDYRV